MSVDLFFGIDETFITPEDTQELLIQLIELGAKTTLCTNLLKVKPYKARNMKRRRMIKAMGFSWEDYDRKVYFEDRQAIDCNALEKEFSSRLIPETNSFLHAYALTDSCYHKVNGYIENPYAFVAAYMILVQNFVTPTLDINRCYKLAYNYSRGRIKQKQCGCCKTTYYTMTPAYNGCYICNDGSSSLNDDDYSPHGRTNAIPEKIAI